MKIKPFLLTITFLALGYPATLRAADEAHFVRTTVPRDEARILALAGVREFRCDYQLGHFSGQTLLIAELYEDGKCAHRYRMSPAVYDNKKKTDKGIISIGWNTNLNALVTVNDNDEFYSPWTVSVVIPGFRPLDGHFFENSKAETRSPDDPQSVPYSLYPVLGLCGDRTLKISYDWDADVPKYLGACKAAGARQVIIVYLYQSAFGEEPSMRFDK